MRKLPYLLVLLLASLLLLAAAASAHALVLPSPAAAPIANPHLDDEAEGEDDEGDEGDDESVPVEEVDDENEDCEGDEACEEELEAEEAATLRSQKQRGGEDGRRDSLRGGSLHRRHRQSRHASRYPSISPSQVAASRR